MTGSRWSPKRAPSSPRCSSAWSMPAPGRCRCRCRPRSAARTAISTSSASSLRAAIRRCCSIPPELAEMAGEAAQLAGSRAMDWEEFVARRAYRGRAAASRRPTTSPICNIRADRPASRTASRSPTARCSTISPRTATAWSFSRQRPLRLAGCPGITTWGWSAASSRRSPTRSRPIISRPRISRAARSPGST